MTAHTWLLLADLTLVLHMGVVAFIMLVVPLAWLGRWRNWQWVGNRWLRGIHLLCIAYVAVQSWLGLVCPLTVFEMWCRRQAGDATHDIPFVQHWLEQMLYPGWPAWVFVAAYSGFFGWVLLTLWGVKVRWRETSPCNHEP